MPLCHYPIIENILTLNKYKSMRSNLSSRRLMGGQALNNSLALAKYKFRKQMQQKHKAKQQQQSKEIRVNKFKAAYQDAFGKNAKGERQQVRLKRDVNFDTGTLYILKFQHKKDLWSFTMRERTGKTQFLVKIAPRLECTCIDFRQNDEATCRHINYIFIQVADNIKLFSSIYECRISQSQFTQISGILQEKFILRIQGMSIFDQEADQFCNICFKKRNWKQDRYHCHNCQYQYHKFCVDLAQAAQFHNCFICNSPFPQTEPDSNRILKAKSQRMYVLNFRRSKRGYWTISLYGNSLNEYSISMTSAIQCTCPDFLKKMEFCKHIYYVIIKMARQQQLLTRSPESSSFTKEYLEIIDDSLLEKWPIFIQKSIDFTGRNPKEKYRQGRNKYCIICFEKFDNDSIRDDKERCQLCSFKYHRICLRNWRVKYDQKICPKCDKEQIYIIEIDENKFKKKALESENKQSRPTQKSIRID